MGWDVPGGVGMTWTASVLSEYEGAFGDYHSVNVDGPERVAVVACSKTKHNPGEGNTLPAERLYSKSDYFSKSWKYAGLVADYAYILSAEHALVHPEDELEYYNTYIGNLDADELEELRTEVRWQLGGAAGGEIPIGAELLVLGSKQYVSLVRDALEATDFGGYVRLSTPLQDLEENNIGQQKSWLKERIEDEKPTQQITLGEAVAQ